MWPNLATLVVREMFSSFSCGHKARCKKEEEEEVLIN